MTTRSKTAAWSGRFSKGLAPDAQKFTASVHFDGRLYLWDILGSLAHAKALRRCKVLTPGEEKKIERGLRDILDEIKTGRFKFNPQWEDVHRNIEMRLMKKIGPLGGKLHTGRSRNDQVATDMRLYVRSQLAALHGALQQLQRTLVKRAQEHLRTVLPGLTHMQPAQPVVLAHHLMAYFEMLARDDDRVREVFRRVNVLPLGAGALAGTGFPIDRERIAKELNFSGASRNSLDAVSDRDFAIDVAHVCSVTMVHLSRLSEELILWSNPQFDFVRLPEDYATGSSMMPQKMNPDIPELVRGKVGRVLGHYTGLVTLMKGLPLSYNRDLQEDKEPLFDCFDTTISSVLIMDKVMGGARFNEARMLDAASNGMMWATDVADYLVGKKIPFRQAHEIVARLIRTLETSSLELTQLNARDLKKISPALGPEIVALLDPYAQVNRRNVVGGTAPTAVAKEIRRAETTLKKNRILKDA